MTPRPVFAAACSLLLLGSTAVTALAHDGFPTRVTHSTAPRVAVTGHVSTYWAINHDPARDHAVRQLTLHVTGSHFTPGSTVRITVLNTARRVIIARGSTRAGPADTLVLCRDEERLCSRPNNHAGAIDYRVLLSPAPVAANLQVLYRSGRARGIRAVALLVSSTATAHAPGAAPQHQSEAAALAGSYIATLNLSLLSRDFRSLGAAFSPHATVTEHITRGLDGTSPRTVATARGRAAILRFYRQFAATTPVTRWVVGTTKRISARTIEIFAQTPGAAFPAIYSVQRLTERNGLITRLEWGLAYVP